MPNDLSGLLQSVLGVGLLAGQHNVDISDTSARTDVGRDGEVHYYLDVDNSTVIKQIYVLRYGAWVSDTLT